MPSYEEIKHTIEYVGKWVSWMNTYEGCEPSDGLAGLHEAMEVSHYLSDEIEVGLCELAMEYIGEAAATWIPEMISQLYPDSKEAQVSFDELMADPIWDPTPDESA